MLIGFGHKRRVGKDTAADFLVLEYGFRKFGFAHALKDAAMVLFHFSCDQVYGEGKGQIDPRYGKSPGKLLQELGLVAREMWGGDFWIDRLAASIQLATGFAPGKGHVNAAITDVRFLNEVEAVRRWGGKLVKIVRPALDALDINDGRDSKHVSETELDSFEGWDAVLVNDGSKEELYQKLGAACSAQLMKERG